MWQLNLGLLREEKMAKRTIMRMKKMPNRPVRYMERKECPIGDGDTLDKIARFFIDIGIHPTEVRFECYNDYDDYVSCSFYASAPESEEAFNAKIAKYELKLQAYNAWYERNKESIEVELAKKQEQAKEKKIKAEERAKKNLELDRIRTAKELARIDKKLKQISPR